MWSLLLAVTFGAGFAAFAWYFMQRAPSRQHDPVEYYRGLAGYSHPVTLTIPITKDEADALRIADIEAPELPAPEDGHGCLGKRSRRRPRRRECRGNSAK